MASSGRINALVCVICLVLVFFVTFFSSKFLPQFVLLILLLYHTYITQFNKSYRFIVCAAAARWRHVVNSHIDVVVVEVYRRRNTVPHDVYNSATDWCWFQSLAVESRGDDAFSRFPRERVQRQRVVLPQCRGW